MKKKIIVPICIPTRITTPAYPPATTYIGPASGLVLGRTDEKRGKICDYGNSKYINHFGGFLLQDKSVFSPFWSLLKEVPVFWSLRPSASICLLSVCLFFSYLSVSVSLSVSPSVCLSVCLSVYLSVCLSVSLSLSLLLSVSSLAN